MEVFKELWFITGKNYGSIPKTMVMELWFTMDKICGTMEKKTMVIYPKTLELWFAMENIYYYGKNFGTIVNYSYNSIFLLGR